MVLEEFNQNRKEDAREEFKKRRKEGSQVLDQKIITTFSKKGAIAIHQFGSVAKGKEDEFSDKDLWITVLDDDLDKIVEERDGLYLSMGEIVIKFEPPQNAPPGGMYSMVIHKTDFGLYHIDYYLVSKSKTKILPESKVIYGDDSLPRGDWFEDQKTSNIPGLNSSASRIDFLICMSFIGVKYVVRQGKPFLDFLVQEYNKNKSEHFPGLPELENGYDFKTVRFILDQHYSVADAKQKAAIEQVKEYLSEIEVLY